MKSPLAARVGLEVRGELIAQGKTQNDLADALGLSQQAISRRLRGVIPFDVVEITEVSEYLGVPISQFMPAAATVA